MKKIIFLMLIAILGFQQGVAQTFTFGGLNYNVTSPTTVEVAVNSTVSGNVIVPAQVTYNSGTYSVNSIGYQAFYTCTTLTSVTIPNSVTSIGDYAFVGCSGLTSVTMPDSVTSIGAYTFQNCSGLTAVIISTSVTSIGNNVFVNCSGLTSVSIPNSVTSIGDSAFFGCSGLTSITIPNSVTSIGEQAFRFCSGLTSVNISTSVTNIGDSTFLGCSSLTSVTIPNSVTSIGNGAFKNCSGLTSVTIPNSVTYIGDSAFSSCYGLTSVTIPNSVTSFGGFAFSYCIGLTSVTVNWSTPLAINNTVFNGVNTPTVVLNVPNGTASIYDATSVWTDFIINEALSVTPFSATNAFNLIAYPNPSNNVFNFKINGANDDTVSLLVYDMTGRQIENKVVNANDFKNISLGQNYSGGVYNVIVAQGRNSKMVRLVKE
ncbi:MAG: leucine-rich repeat domain-containing protein [Flavobacterium sp.]|nr:leucine-rich repeat domain-containing protein [Flavobacterium sp.]